MLFPVSPDVFDRVQFRRVAGEVLHPQALTLLSDEIAGDLAAMGGEPIPDEQQRSGNVTEQRLKKVDYLGALDAAFVQPKIEVIERDSRRRREGLPIEVVLQNGSLAAWRPGAHPVRPLAYPAFVDEDDRAPFFLGFFLMAGHSTCRQRRMASSFRSRARPTGRWQLQPRSSRIFHTWPG